MVIFNPGSSQGCVCVRTMNTHRQQQPKKVARKKSVYDKSEWGSLLLLFALGFCMR